MLLKSIKIVVNQIYLVPENSPKWYSPTFEPIHSALGIFRLESLYHNVEISAIHILREIDFGKIKVLKTSILTIWYLANFSPDKMQKSTKTKLLCAETVWTVDFETPKSLKLNSRTCNLSGRKISTLCVQMLKDYLIK